MPAILSELSDVSFNMWKRHPISQLLLQFLTHAKRSVLYDHLQRWEHNTPMTAGSEDEARGAARVYGEIATIELAHIRDFYGVRDPALPPETEEEG